MKKKLSYIILSILTVSMLSSCTLFRMVADMKILAEAYDNIAYEVMDALPDTLSDFVDGRTADGKWVLRSSESDSVFSFGLAEGEVLQAGDFLYTKLEVDTGRTVRKDPNGSPVISELMSFDAKYRKGGASNFLTVTNGTETAIGGTWKGKDVSCLPPGEIAELYDGVKKETPGTGYTYESVSGTLSRYTYSVDGPEGWSITAMERMTKCLMKVNGSVYDLLKLM